MTGIINDIKQITLQLVNYVNKIQNKVKKLQVNKSGGLDKINVNNGG